MPSVKSNTCPHCGKSLAQTSFTENPKTSPQTSLKHLAPVSADDDILSESETPKPKAKKA